MSIATLQKLKAKPKHSGTVSAEDIKGYEKDMQGFIGYGRIFKDTF
jgi:hypothetical protein